MGELTIADLVNPGVSAAQTPAGSTPALSGANQPQSPNNGQGVLLNTPVNYVPWVAGGLAVLALIGFIVLKK